MSTDDQPDFEAATIADDHALPRVLLAALEETSSPVCITTAELDAPGPTIVYVNPAYCRMTRRRRDDVIGQSPRIMQGPLTDRRVLDRLRDDLAAGRRFSGETYNYRADGEPFRIAWSIDPVVGDDGVATHFVATQRDVTGEVATERLRQAEEGLDGALVDALAAPVDSVSGLALLADGIAAGAALIVGFGMVEARIQDPALGTIRGVTHSEHHEANTDDGVAATASIQLPILRVDGTAIGSITVAGLRPAEREVIDRLGLTRLAERAASVIAGLAEYQRQRRTALRLQDAILPRLAEAPVGFEVASRYVPGADGVHVGGDWFDVIETDHDVVIIVGDVSGHGIDAATTMARLQTLTSAEVRAERPFSEVFDVLDRACRDDNTMATLAVARLRTDDDHVQVWSAGHLPPISFGPDGAALIPVRTAPPLGHLQGDRPEVATTRLGPGEGLVLFTDGLVERRNEPLPDGLERLRTALAGEQGALDDLLDRLTEAQRADDDTAIVAVRRNQRDRERLPDAVG